MKKFDYFKLISGLLVLMLMLTCVPNLSAAAKTTNRKANMNKLVNEINDWIGYQYSYNLKKGKAKSYCLDDRQLYNIVGIGMSAPTTKKLKARTSLIFGLKPNTSSIKKFSSEDAFNTSEENVGRLAKNKFITKIGEWGESGPFQKINKIKNNGMGRYEVTVTTYFSEPEAKAKKVGVSTYTIQTCDSNKYGYVISSITLNKR